MAKHCTPKYMTGEYYCWNFTVNIIRPDGTNETLAPFESSSTDGYYTTFIPQTAGNNTIPATIGTPVMKIIDFSDVALLAERCLDPRSSSPAFENTHKTTGKLSSLSFSFFYFSRVRAENAFRTEMLNAIL
jgi:hypothetical protein